MYCILAYFFCEFHQFNPLLSKIVNFFHFSSWQTQIILPGKTKRLYIQTRLLSDKPKLGFLQQILMFCCHDNGKIISPQEHFNITWPHFIPLASRQPCLDHTIECSINPRKTFTHSTSYRYFAKFQFTLALHIYSPRVDICHQLCSPCLPVLEEVERHC